MKKIGVLTKFDPNHGSCAFDSSLFNLLKEKRENDEIKFLDCYIFRTRFYEYMRALKINRKIPFYNLQRFIRLTRFTKNSLPLDPLNSIGSYENRCQKINEKEYDALIVAKVVWDITYENQLPLFPNLYWLSEKITSQKFAYAISGHRTNLELFKQRKNRVKKILSSYQLIGVRDDMTQVMMEESGVDKLVPVSRISDPAFLYKVKPINIGSLFEKFGISDQKPILGLLYYGKPILSTEVSQHYRKKGYQILNFNMFNPYADINIGHLVDPDEWATLFKALTFCITDRFHASIFCMRENVPFASIEPFKPQTLLNSKVYSLLKDFKLVEPCYHDPYQAGFSIPEFIDTCEKIESSWKVDYSDALTRKIKAKNKNQLEFLDKINQMIG